VGTHRLYLPERIVAGTDVALDAERSHYVARVLRARPGSALVVFDGHGGEYDATVRAVSKHAVTLAVGSWRPDERESPLEVRLLQGVSRGERMDWVVQKATELGVARIMPVITEFSVVRLEPERAGRRLAHWRKIAQGACEQCGRNRVPAIEPPASFAALVGEASDATRILLEPGAPHTLAAIERGPVELLIGPEGGLSAGEREQALAAGFRPCSLGPRVLRTETAAVAALAVLQARLGV